MDEEAEISDGVVVEVIDLEIVDEGVVGSHLCCLDGVTFSVEEKQQVTNTEVDGIDPAARGCGFEGNARGAHGWDGVPGQSRRQPRTGAMTRPIRFRRRRSRALSDHRTAAQKVCCTKQSCR